MNFFLLTILITAGLGGGRLVHVIVGTPGALMM